MIKILHCSDIHFKEEELDYCSKVWAEILDIGKSEKVEAICVAGDVFDTFEDLVACRETFLKLAVDSKLRIIAIAGNHEYLHIKNQNLATYDLSKISWFHNPGFHLATDESDSWELYALPYSQDYADYRNWKIPQKKKRRLLMAHGMLPEAVAYTGPDSEEGSHILEIDLLSKFDADCILLGHIHKRTDLQINGLSVHYPGSPRVWRKGEKGQRSVNLIEIPESGSIQVKALALAQAGVYREVLLNIEPNGNVQAWEPDQISANKEDYLSIELQGVADNETILNIWRDTKLKEWSQNYRKVAINTEMIKYLDGFSSEAIVKKFLEKWNVKFAESPEDKIPILLKARQIGLEEIIGKIKS